MEPFAKAGELATRLRREFNDEEKKWLDELLVDASAHLRDVIGDPVFPRVTTTYTAYPSGGREDIPGKPIVSVDAVTRAGVDVPFQYRPGYITVSGDEPCEVTFTSGYEEAPRELARLACVLVSQTLITLEAQLGLTAGGLSSAAIDDFRLAWANAGEQSGMELQPRTEDMLRDRYGAGRVYVGGTSG